MYYCFLDNSMPLGMLAEYFKTTEQTVTICASIRIFRDLTSFKGCLPKAFPCCMHCCFASPLRLIESIRRRTHLSVIRLLADNTCQSVIPLQREIL